MAYTKTTWQDLPNTSTPINATRLNNIENGIKSIDDKFLLSNDTAGSTWQELAKNKLDYCIANFNTSNTDDICFINGGWQGVEYGYGIFSKLGNIYQLTFYYLDAIIYARKLDNGTYQYTYYEPTTDTGWINLATASNFESLSWGQLRYRKKNGVVTIVGVLKALVNTGWLTLVANLPDGFRPPMEYDVVCRTSRAEVIKLVVNEVGEIYTLDTSAGTYLQPNDNLEIAVTYIAA